MQPVKNMSDRAEVVALTDELIGMVTDLITPYGTVERSGNTLTLTTPKGQRRDWVTAYLQVREGKMSLSTLWGQHKTFKLDRAKLTLVAQKTALAMRDMIGL